MKPMTALMTAAVFSVLSLNACGGSEKSMSIQEQTEARFRLNSNKQGNKTNINDSKLTQQHINIQSIDKVIINWR